MRLFLAIEVDDAVRRAAAAVMTRAREALGSAAGAFRWTPEENLHITLHFLGSVQDDRLSHLKDTLGARLEIAAFEAGTGGLGMFPPRGVSRTLWLAIERGVEPMRQVHRVLATRVRLAGLEVETRAFTPHLTLARLRDRDRHEARDVARRLAGLETASAAWQIGRAVLMQSDLSGPRPRYTVVHEVVFAT